MLHVKKTGEVTESEASYTRVCAVLTTSGTLVYLDPGSVVEWAVGDGQAIAGRREGIPIIVPCSKIEIIFCLDEFDKIPDLAESDAVRTFED